MSPLHHAAASETPAAITRLLAAGADPEARDQRGRTPIELAANLHRTAAVRALLAKPPADPIPWLLLATFAQRGSKKDQAMLATLLTVLAPDAPPAPGYGYALHIAAHDGFAQSVRALLAAGAEIDRLDHRGRTAAFLAISAVANSLMPRPLHLAAFDALVEAGANLDIPIEQTTARAIAARVSAASKR